MAWITTRRGWGQTFDEVGSDINDDRSRLEPRSLNEVGFSNSGYNNISLSKLWRHQLVSSKPPSLGEGKTHDSRQVLSATVALGDSGVLSPEEGADGTSNDVTSSQYDGVLSSEVNSGRLEEEHNSGGGAGREQGSRSSGGKESNVVSVESGR